MQDEPERRQIQKSIRSPPESPPPRSGVPYLYKWMCKLHVTLLAKVDNAFYLCWGPSFRGQCIVVIKQLLSGADPGIIQ